MYDILIVFNEGKSLRSNTRVLTPSYLVNPASVVSHKKPVDLSKYRLFKLFCGNPLLSLRILLKYQLSCAGAKKETAESEMHEHSFNIKVSAILVGGEGTRKCKPSIGLKK